MSKAFKGRTCVYCTVDGSSTTADHVLAREFFPADCRHGIPKVPSCNSCNNAKSHLEHYLCTALPFGGRHKRSAEILTELVPRRLERNQKLKVEFTGGLSSGASVSRAGHIQPRKTFNVDADKIVQLYEFIVRGLCWSEWQLLLPKSISEIQVGLLTSDGAEIADRLLNLNSKRRSHGLVADGLFQYEGVQAVDNDLITIWKMSLYGVEFADAENSKEHAFVFYASSGPIGKVLPIGLD